MPVPIRKVRRFHAGRLVFWTAQIPLALLVFPQLKASLSYLVALSIAALIESALTDYLQARESEQQDPSAAL